MKSSNSNVSNSTCQSKTDLIQYKTNFTNLVLSFNDISIVQNDFLANVNNNFYHSDLQFKIPAIDSILDSYALKVARKKDTYEKISTLEGICEGNDIFLIKRWKRKCRFMLELISEIYRSYQIVLEMQNNGNLTSVDIETVTTYLHSLSSNDSIKFDNTEFDKWDFYVHISSVFLQDFIKNFNSYRNELQQQLVIKQRLFYVLKKAKDQRARLKVYVNKLREEICYVEKKLRQSANLMKSKLNTNSSEDITSLVDETTFCVNSCSNIDVEYYENKISELEKIIKEEERRRKHLHNKFQELIGNTRVFCRIRPSETCCFKLSNDDKIILPLNVSPEKSTRSSGGSTSTSCYIFDKVFDSTAGQQDIFTNVDPLITSCIDGYNVGIMVYGQNQSGKSFTMLGNNDNLGIVTLSIRELLHKCSSRNQWKYKLSLSVLELYQEEAYDLLITPKVPGTNVSNKIPNLKLVIDNSGNYLFNGLTEKIFDNELIALELMKLAESNRKTGWNLYNISESHTHLMIIVKIIGLNCQINTGGRSHSFMIFCDLASSENAAKYKEDFSHPSHYSLSALGRVFDAMRKSQKPIYKDSKLTYLLKPSLGGDSKSVLFINIRSELEFLNETRNSLKFGENAMQILSNKNKM